jgi:recombination DNA repair RAD52 pathway protein
VELPGGVKTEFIDYGYGDGSDKFKIGKAHELAVKEAVTDGIKRCAKNLGMSMGLALYDKTQENVEDAAPEKPAAQAPARTRDITGYMPEKKTPPAPAATGESLDDLVKGISANSRVVITKKLRTADQIRSEMAAKYGTDDKTKLTVEQAKELLEQLKGLANNGK